MFGYISHFKFIPPMNIETLKKFILNKLNSNQKIPIWELEQKFTKKPTAFSVDQFRQAIDELIKSGKIKRERGWLFVPEEDDDTKEIIIPPYPWVPF